MDFYLFLLFFLATALFCRVLLYFGSLKRLEDGKDTSNKCGLALTASIALGWILLLVATPSSVFPSNEFIFELYPFLIAAAALSMYMIAPMNIKRFWVYFGVTLLSVVFIPDTFFVFQGFLPLFFDRFLTALLWAIFISVYAKVDKVNGLTIIQTAALCLAFMLFPYLSRMYSGTFTYYPMLILAGLIAFMTYKKHNPEVLLGKTGAVPLGYLMGLFLILMAVKGYWMAAFTMPAYIYFEAIYSTIYRWFHRANPQPGVFNFFVMGVVRKNLDVAKLTPFLFINLFGFALIGILFNRDIKWTATVTVLLFVVLLYRLLHWGEPKITYRSMFRDTKEAALTVGENVKDSLNTVSAYFKNKNKK